MYIKQLSIFIENREGRLKEVLEILKKGGVNIVSMSLADTSEYGLLRLMVDNPQAGKAVLQEHSVPVMLTEVLGIRLAHRVGRLQELLEIICDAGINIEYLYGLSSGADASVVIKASDMEKAVEVLQKNEVELVSAEDIIKM